MKGSVTHLKRIIVLGLAGGLLAALAWAQAPKTLTVSIEGVEGELRRNVAAFLEIQRSAGQPVTDETRLRWLHARADEDIRNALKPFGYYRPDIEASLEETAAGWTARYRIEPGPPVRISRLEVVVLGEGKDDPPFQKLLAESPLSEGGILVQPPYEDLKRRLQWLATDRGYFDAEFKAHEIRIDLEHDSAEVILRFDTGRRYRFGQIRFPDTVLAPEFLRRYVKFQPDDPYVSSDLLKLQSALINSDYFDQVEVAAPYEQAEDYRIPVEVRLKMLPSRKFSFGLGYGTDTGPRGKVGFEYRYLNRWGHRFKTELLGSQIKYGASAEYTIPGADPTTDLYSLRAKLLRENSDVKDTYSATLGGSWKKQFGLWQRILSLDYLVESFSFDSDEQLTKLLIPGMTWTRVQSDDPLNVRRGSRLQLQLQGAYQPLLSDLSFIQPVVRGKLIHGLGERGRLLVRGDVGTTWVSDFDKFPASLRFFAGGDNSVRGYDLDKIGPVNREGDVIGGKHLLVGSLEYEYPLWWEKWSVAVFVDSGDAFDDTPDLKTGVGFGVRWQSPVGPVRVDLASGLDRPPGDIIRLHLSIGPEL